MNLKNLFDFQKELDQKIKIQHNLQNSTLLSKKILALQVEIGELANETRCFKFWSTKKSSPSDIVLEEYVDCLHFILSIGLEKKFETDSLELKKTDCDLTEQFINLYVDINDFIVCSSKDHYITLFEDFLSLGFSLGFTENDIEDGYNKKNSINHLRQATGY